LTLLFTLWTEIYRGTLEALFYGLVCRPEVGAGVQRSCDALHRNTEYHRVFITPIQEAYIIGLNGRDGCCGSKPIVEDTQFADYILGRDESTRWKNFPRVVYISKGKFRYRFA
jgi:pyruvate/2-oxoglutarate/acetoin dehydrogenase E1 component